MDNSKKIGNALIIAGGEFDEDFIKDYLKENKFDTVACADSGLDRAKRMGLKVDFVMGDFDSVSEETMSYYRKISDENTEFVKYPAEKDATDLHIVLDYIVEKFPENIVVLGATGRRLDHFIANINILMKPLSYGIPTYIVDKWNRLYLIDHSQIIRKEEMFGKYISFIPFTETVESVYLKGFKYDVDNGSFTKGNSLGVSNEIAGDKDAALIEFGDGVFIVVESRD